MKSITIHNLDGLLDTEIKKLAHTKGQSLNKTIKDLLRKSVGLEKNNDYRKDFIGFFGVWSETDEKEFNNSIKDFEKVNLQDWK